MFKYSTFFINVVSIIISIVIFTSALCFMSVAKPFKTAQLKAGFNTSNNQTQTKEEIDNKEFAYTPFKNITKDNTAISEMTKSWYIEIPVISLNAEIAEGTTKEVMDDYIGHFEETEELEGNIGLAAHNRGYKNNYFAKIKTLKEGDEIYYHYNGNTKKYEVKSNYIISDTNWEVLSNSGKNMITLITCVENQPEYRRCVQAEEIT